MKYPKTVSTRAVNAISDWLVSRLEQLGVEAPHMYIRLLLSILQSTNDINDPTELNNLETFRASRKGGNRRNGEFEADAFKKFNAVQILKDIVSSEQEIATVEILIDELCAKLKDFERESESEDDDKLLSQLQNHQVFNNYQQQKAQQTKEVSAYSKSCNATCAIESVKVVNKPLATSSSSKSAKLEEKNSDSSEYFRAFPALNKEMEDSVNFWRRSAKWLPWPADKSQRNEAASTSSASSSTMSSNSCAENATKDVQNYPQDVATNAVNTINAQPINALDKKMGNEEKSITAAGSQQQMMSDDDAIINDEIVDEIVDENGDNASAYGACSAAYGAIKRKTKRTRRNRALSKGKTNQQNQRKNPTSGSNGGNGNKRTLSPSVWDTDFEGCWEMGRDLIKEFITSQNRNSRNRSTSESAVAYNKKNITKKAEAKAAGNEIDDNYSVVNKENTAINEKQHPQRTNEKAYSADSHGVDEHAEEGAVKPATPLPALIDISFCDYDDYDDTLATVSELTNDGPLVNLATGGEGATATATPKAAKRLYERELQTSDTQNDVQSDFAQYEAKFDSSVKALWKDAHSAADAQKGFPTFGNSFHTSGSGGHYSGPISLPTVAPFSQTLRNFWSNYYNHHFDLSRILPTGIVGSNSDDINVLKQNTESLNSAGANSNIAQVEETITAPTSDYFSMPSNLGEMKRGNHKTGCSESANAGLRRGGTIGEERKTPIAPFFPNSIWSTNAYSGGGDTDESFYFKVHNSARQLSQNDSAACSNSETTEQLMHQNDAIATTSTGLPGSNSFTFTAPYTTSKWSEGINAGPAQVNSSAMLLTALPQQHMNQSNPYRTGTDCTDSSTSRATNWQHLAKGESKVDGQMHETNAAGCSPCDSVSSEVTLPNHSTRSGFIAYSRIKTVLEYKFTKRNFESFLLEQIRNQAQQDLALRREQLEAMHLEELMEEQEELEQKIKQQIRREEQQEKEQQQQKDAHPMEIVDESENLLTSEKTHFHPIKFYPDGHTFDICSELDVVEYERSSSGSLYFEHDRYLEYTRGDNFVVDDDHGIGASSNPLYANSNCEAATSANAKANKNANKYNRNATKANRSKQNFVPRFRVKRNEIACQTDVDPPTARTPLNANSSTMLSGIASGSLFTNYRTATRPHPLSLIFSNAAKNLKATAKNELVYNDTAEAFTRAIAHFQPPPPPLTTASNSAWLPIAADAGDHSWNAYRQRQQQNARSNARQNVNGNDAGSDEVDFYANFADYGDIVGYRGTVISANVDMNMPSLEQEWSMNQIHKRCREAGHMTASGNNNGVECGAESVWDMCPACNNEIISIPANRLLRDELQLEGDEIMSDLRYMQDLYIGSADDDDVSDDDGGDDNADYDGGENDDNDVESVANTETSDSDWCVDEVTADAADEFEANPNVNDAMNSVDEEPAIRRHIDMGSSVANPNLNATINSIDDEIAFHRRADLRVNVANTNLNDTVNSIDEEPAMCCHTDMENNASNTNFSSTPEAIEKGPTESKNNAVNSNLNDTINTIDEELAFHCHADFATNAANPNINVDTNSIDEDPANRSRTDTIKNDDTAAEGSANNDSETMTVIQKVNRLIAELLRPDNNSVDGEQMDEVNANYGSNSAKGDEQPRSGECGKVPTTQFRGNLWHTNGNERNIWQLNLSNSSGNSGGIISGASVHPLKLLRQYNVKTAETAVHADNESSAPATNGNANDKYHTEMMWEHENLARIWQSSTPLPPQLQPQANTAIMTIKNVSPLLTTDENQSENDVKTDIAEKNMRNLRANADASVAAAAANLQLAQEFMVKNSSHQNKVAAALTGAQLVDSALKIKAATRKRRHSASQNYFHAHFNSSGNGDTLTDAASHNLVMQNNNNKEIANLNSQILKSSLDDNCSTSAPSTNANDLSLQNFLNASLRFGAAAAVAAVAASKTNMNSDYANNLCGANITFDCDSNAANGGNQTIITCQYHLTAIKPLGDAEADVDEFEVFTGNGNASTGGGTGRCGGVGDAAPFSNVIDKNPSILQHVTMTSRPLTR
ncbi:uncharacterized protein LOC101459677 [Ceratitis capitata]|uniref:uncharacterized protein LOC101459677 n=1 Tax=Ceratitis capitata TaxID=7213 RepID=UPI00032A3FC8|nr:uncharacterized protein LOC101459677 [Ceratitis capitata]XP_012161081.1 uncharacterized protein LOC101459677 [Ceratitis capitata]XP_012161082.1 uncharacterized protein LOC101459677 [Ceratitis capitata]XP_012161083.1 uncharacterized protein LOC101459677 [Ceratitis capitata]XP_012161084.1 uncharacterized protein LOC101459677 [Ceratitis capitata]XP_012161086.1 uncharacterized protein LOC101459677 [Ceratitis capitata]XP_020716804.1 uncharacterized protein LOC101459677 [Ceratitis capitata]XP_0